MNIISIIIPVYNESKILSKTLKKIEENDFGSYNVEVIVVDNGSTDNPQLVTQKHDVKIINEHNNKNSPYSARNRGIELSNGDVIVLLDSTCRPDAHWLLAGVNKLKDCNADIVGGKVLFDFEGKMTASKIYDSLTNINMKNSIDEGIAKTANLFIRREVFNVVGLFPEKVRSGADVRWTGLATKKMGLKLVYSEEAQVEKIARGFKELIKKQRRVARYQPIIWAENSKNNLSKYVKNFLKIFVPRRAHLKKLIKQRGEPKMEKYLFRLIVIGFWIKLNMFIFNFIGLISLKLQSRKESTPH